MVRFSPALKHKAVAVSMSALVLASTAFIPLSSAHGFGVKLGLGRFFKNTNGVHASGSTTVHGSGSIRNPYKKDLTDAQRSCIRTAVGKRETSIVTAYGAFNTSVAAALSTRGTALAAAWNISTTTERNTAIANAWKAYNSSVKAASQTMRTTRQNIWKTFRTDVKNCGVSTMNIDGNVQGDMNLQIGL